MDPMAEIRQTFFQECADLLEELEAGLLEMEDGGADSETVNAIFRAVHSIKGGAGAFGLDALVRFAHIFETTLDEVRSERLEATADVMKTLLRSADVLADLVRSSEAGDEIDESQSAPLIAELETLAGIDGDAGTDNSGDEEEIDFQPVGLDFDFGDVGESEDESETDETDTAKTRVFDIFFRPKPSLYRNANEATILLRELSTLGETDLACNTDNVPLLDEIDPEGAYFSWNVRLDTEREGVDVWDVFEFVDGDCDLTIAPQETAEPTLVDDASLSDSISEPTSEQTDDITQIDLAPLTDDKPSPSDNEPAAKTDADAAPADVPAPPPAPAEAPKAAASKPESTKKSPPNATVRVDLGRVDRLINLVGELVINQAMLTQCASEAGLARSSNVESRLDELKQLTRELQESVMAIRAQPIKPLFQRMSRIVREAADATGKSVRLMTEGEATEIDKTVIERLADPLTHMIRNAVDHGIESREKREAAGKSDEGTVILSASHRSGRVVIEISDDGAGINRERVRQIAEEKGLIAEDAKLTDNEIDNLIFMPGFSTAKEVSALSGRGVGMDVVKRSIQSLGGKASIASMPGKGSIFTISLPLTLAILDGMVVDAEQETLVVPLTAIVETWKASPRDIHELGSGDKVLSIRGAFIPLIDVGCALGYRTEPIDPSDGVVICVENNEGGQSAIIVDAIQDQRQVVIKSLEENYGAVPYVAAATILGDGRIALILDVDALTAAAPSSASIDTQLLAKAG